MAFPHQVVLVLDDYHLVTNPEIDEGLSSFSTTFPRPSSSCSRAVPSLRSRSPAYAPRVNSPRSTRNSFASPTRRPTSFSTTFTGSTSTGRCHPASRAHRGMGGRSLPGDPYHSRTGKRARVHRGVCGRPPPCRRLPELGGARRPARGDEGLPPAYVRARTSRASLCDAITDRPGSALTLHELERSNFFLVPLDAKREWYGYHQLFGDLLRHELALADPSTLRPCIAGRALGTETMATHPRRFSRHGGKGLRRCLRALRHWIEFRNEARLETLLAWIDGLPPEAVTADARLAS